MRRELTGLGTATAVLLAAGCGGKPGPAAAEDLVLYNGKIFTSAIERPFVEAIRIRGDRVVEVGTTAAVRAAAGGGARAIDLAGRVVVPGFNDAHDHVGGTLPAVKVITGTDPLPDPAYQVLADILRAAAARAPTGARLEIDVGERILSDSRARRDALDRLAPGHAVSLLAWTGHDVVLNSAALAEAGIAESTPDPLGGRLERRNGRLSGLLEEYAAYGRVPPGVSDSVVRAAFAARAAAAASLGITSIQVMMTWHSPAETARLADSLDLPVRFRLIRLPTTSATGRITGGWNALATRREGRVTLSGFKYILDGTPVERRAMLRAPYADRAGWSGRLNFPPDTLRAILTEALAANEQPLIHAVGDSAVGLVIATLTALATDSVWRRLRPRIEHGEGLAPDLFRRAAQLGVVLVQNPTHLALGLLAAARYGPERMKTLQPLKSALDQGIVLAIGSDGPQNPFVNLMFAVIHPDNPAEKITMEQAVRAYTFGSAYAEFQEGQKGVLAPGMLADLAVLSQDVFTIPPDRLPATRSVLTLVGGRAVFDPEGLSSKVATRP